MKWLRTAWAVLTMRRVRLRPPTAEEEAEMDAMLKRILSPAEYARTMAVRTRMKAEEPPH